MENPFSNLILFYPNYFIHMGTWSLLCGMVLWKFISKKLTRKPCIQVSVWKTFSLGCFFSRNCGFIYIEKMGDNMNFADALSATKTAVSLAVAKVYGKKAAAYTNHLLG